MHSPGSNKKNTKILDMQASIPGTFNSQVQWWKASDLYFTIFSVCNMFKNNKNIVLAQCYPWL